MENINNSSEDLYEFYPIPDFPWYLINKMGQIYCKKHKYIRRDKLKIAEEGIVKVTSCGGKSYNFANLLGFGRFKVADLMGHTFLTFDFERRIVNHKNRIKNDDRLENLEYTNKGEDISHMLKNLTKEEKKARSTSLSICRTGKPLSQEHCMAISISQTGKSLSLEHKATISASLLGKPLSPEHREAISRGSKGKKRKPFSPEHRAAISKGNKGKKRSPEFRANLSKKQKGKKLSFEHIANISKAKKGKKI